ncbi:hypothetical protein REPUB_Repub13aG0078800 [Reevesia pubescens]
MLFWIQVHNVMYEMLTKSNATIIGKKIGMVVEVDDPLRMVDIMRGFLRFKARISVHKLLVIGFWILRKGEDRIWSRLKYKKLSNFCFSCGKLRHFEKNCALDDRLGMKSSLRDCFGPHLRTVPLRTCARMRNDIESKSGIILKKEANGGVSRYAFVGKTKENGECGVLELEERNVKVVIGM